MGRSTEGGEQTEYLTLDGKRFLIKQIFFGETGKSEIFYYIDRAQVFYVKKINTEYILPLSEDSTGKVKNTITKEFFLDKEEKLCSWYENGMIQKNDIGSESLIGSLIANI